jgi:serine/threonine-protein kinase RsbW
MTAHGTPAGRTLIYHADIEATLDEVSRVCSELHVLALARGGSEWSAEVDLGLTEALTNVVRHGYGSTPVGGISLTCFESADDWHLTLGDQGKPIPQHRLDPSARSVFDFDPGDLQSIPEGGMGLALIRASFDLMDYEVCRNGNLMSLTKHLSHQAA